MNGHSRDNWRGAHKSKRAIERSAASEPSWKRSGRQKTVGTSRRPWPKMLFAVLAMICLVSLGWWLFQPSDVLHTHFVILDLLSDTAAETNAANSEYFDPISAPVIPSLPESRRPLGRITSTRLESLNFKTEEDDELTNAQVVVIYLQTQTVAIADGSIRCIVKNSTLDLNEETQSEPLTLLRDQLKELTDQGKRVVLIADEAIAQNSWRLGDFQSNLSTQLAGWPLDAQFKNRLVVMTSCSDRQSSAPGRIKGGGQSAFGATVMQGLSEAADIGNTNDNAKKLDVVEFCDFVVRETNAWVQEHRDPSGQSVIVSPPVEELNSANAKFVLLGEVPGAPAPIALNFPTSAATLNELWKRRDKLDQKLAWRWSPMVWQSSTELLLRAQTAMLGGQAEVAEKRSQLAEEAIARLEQATQEIASESDQLNTEFGLPRLWFQRFPNAAVLNQLWNNAEAFAVDTEAAPEFVLKKNLETYPFEKLGPDRSETLKQDVVNLRNTWELAAANSMSLLSLIPKSITSAEQQCLRIEDRLFTVGEQAVLQKDILTNKSLWRSIQEFCEAHQRAEVAFQKSMAASESLAVWAAKFPFDNGIEFQNQWDNLLLKNLPSQVISADAFQGLLDGADALAIKTAPGITSISAPLRADIFRLMCSTRRLGLLLHPTEPDKGFHQEELEKSTAALSATSRILQSAWESIHSRFTELTDNLTQKQGTRPEWVLQQLRLRATIDVASLSADVRAELIDKLIRLDDDLTGSDDQTMRATGDLTVSGQKQALWYLQHLNLFLDRSGQDDVVTALSDAVDAFVAAPLEKQQQSLAAFGASVRAFWLQSRESTTAAITSTRADAMSQLRRADRLSRGFSAFDVAKVSGSATARLQTLWRIEYCLGQADRLISGQWVLPGEGRPFASNGWYARTSQQWLNEAISLAATVGLTSTEVPAFIAKAVDDRRDAISAAGIWEVQASPRGDGYVNLRSHNDPDANLTLDLHFKSTPPSGVASVGFLASAESALVDFPDNSLALDFESDERVLTTSVHREGIPGEGNCEAVDYRPGIFFRGRRFQSERSIRIDPCAAAEFVSTRIARPQTASITVDGDDIRPLAFVLDMSGSMNDPLPGGQKRVAVALDRLSAIVKSRDDRNRASLRVFGHRLKFVDPNSPKSDKDKGVNEDYRRIFRKPIPEDDPQKDVTIEVKQTSLGPDGQKLFANVINQLRQSGPFGVTPLLHALRQAYEEDLNNKPGIIIAITDGIATDAGINPQTLQQDPAYLAYDRTQDLKSVVERNPDIKVILVAFDFQDPKQREALTRIIQRGGIDPRQIANAESGGELQQKIQDGLDPIEFHVSGLAFNRTAALGETVEQLPAGREYDLTYAEISPYRNIPAAAGDKLKLKVNWQQRQFEFDRPSPAKNSVRSDRPNDSQTPWILRKIRAEIRATSVVESPEFGHVSIILMLDHTEQSHPVRQPAEIEFRYTSSRHFRTPTVLEQYFPDNGAPGYRIEIDKWPMDQNVQIEAAWKMERTTPEQVMTYQELTAATSLGASGQLPAAKVSTTFRDGVLEVRLEPAGPVPDSVSTQSSENAIEDIRIEVGTRGELDRNESFEPDEVTTTVHRTESGAVVYRFKGEYTAETLAEKEIAFTSRAKRLAGAIRPPTMTASLNDRDDAP